MRGRSQARKASATRERARPRAPPPRPESSRRPLRPGIQSRRCAERLPKTKQATLSRRLFWGPSRTYATAGRTGRLDLLGLLLGSLLLLRGCLALPCDPLLGRLLLACPLLRLLGRLLLRLLLRGLL